MVAKFRRTRTKTAEDAFAADLRAWDWSALKETVGVDAMAVELESVLSDLTERHFPLVRVMKSA